MTRRFGVPAIALFLSSIMAMTGSAADFASHPQRDGSARYWMRGIVLLLLVLLILWLIYRTFTGWKPMIS